MSWRVKSGSLKGFPFVSTSLDAVRLGDVWIGRWVSVELLSTVVFESVGLGVLGAIVEVWESLEGTDGVGVHEMVGTR